jgi:hypothetical protein
MPSINRLYSLDEQIHGCRLSLQRVCKLTALGSIYASVVGLTGCATNAELEFLRAEVAKANATAVSAEAELSRIQRELVELKAAAKSSDTISEPDTPPLAPSPKPSGYKWGTLSQY